MREPILLSLLTLLALAPAFAQDPSKPKAYALVGAFEDQFTLIYETPAAQRVASPRVDQYRRERVAAPAGTFNRIALVQLDMLYKEREPTSRRTLLSISVKPPGNPGNEQREATVLRQVRAALEPMPERKSWDRIVVALPALQRLEVDRMPRRVEGFGVYLQPNCQSHPKWCAMAFQPTAGATAHTPEGEEIQANFFVAPFSNVAVLTLDPRTFEVLDRQESFTNEKLYDPKAESMDMSKNLDKSFLAERVVENIGASINEAVTGSPKIPKVDVKDVKQVDPAKAEPKK